MLLFQSYHSIIYQFRMHNAT